MKGIELLNFLDKKQLDFIRTAEQSYRRFARIYFQILSFQNNEIVVKVWQTENAARKYLSAKELVSRVKDMFEGKIPENIKLHIHPVPFDPLENFTVSNIKQEMNSLGLQSKDLVKLLNINKSIISLLLARKRPLSKTSKAMFYYLFQYLKIKKENTVIEQGVREK